MKLRCNNHIGGYCRRELQEVAFVTTCMHIFCNDCVYKNHFQDVVGGRRECLACSAALPAAADVVLTNLKPKEDYQATLLSGLSPRTILECVDKGLSFWNYQMSTEIVWQEHLSGEWQNRYSSLHAKANKVIDDANTEIANLRSQIETLNVAKNNTTKQLEQMTKNYKEKTANYQTISTLYHELKQGIAVGKNYGTAAVSIDCGLHSTAAIPRPETLPHFSTRRSTVPEVPLNRTPHRGKHASDQNGVEQLHPFQRSGSTRGATSSEICFAAQGAMPPPARIGAGERIHRLNHSSTPAQRISLNHKPVNNKLLETGYRPSYSQKFAHHPVDEHMQSQYKSRQEPHYHRLNGALTPNVHARVPAERPLY